MSRLRCSRIDGQFYRCGALFVQTERGGKREDTFGENLLPPVFTFFFLCLANDTCSTQTLLNPPFQTENESTLPLHPDGDSHSRFPFLLISEEVTNAENSDVFGKWVSTMNINERKRERENEGGAIDFSTFHSIPSFLWSVLIPSSN